MCARLHRPAALVLIAAWNRYYAATPFSNDVTSLNITDMPPFALEWSLGTDAPLGMKDGHGCLFANRYLVIAGGVWTHLWPGPGGPDSSSRLGSRRDGRADGNRHPEIDVRTTIAYDLFTDSWSTSLPKMPYTALRTTGACGSGDREALFIISGEGSNAVFTGGPASTQAAMLVMKPLTLTAGDAAAAPPEWEWKLLPELPAGQGRWLAAAAELDGWLVLTGGTNTPGIEMADQTRRSAATAAAAAARNGTSAPTPGDGTTGPPCEAVAGPDRAGDFYPRCVVERTVPCECPPWQQTFRLWVGNGTAGEPPMAKDWAVAAGFPGVGYDVPNYGTAGGELYIFGGWRASTAGMWAWQIAADSLYGVSEALELPVPFTMGTTGAELLRHAWRYSAGSDRWDAVPDLPQHMCSGGTVVLRDRYVVQLGSAHGDNSFRVGSRDPAVRNISGNRIGKGNQSGFLPPEVRLQEAGVVGYYGDTVLIYDTVTQKYSRSGVLPYGLVTSHCGCNGTHIICALGEPRHMWNSNTDPVTQIAKIVWTEDA